MSYRDNSTLEEMLIFAGVQFLIKGDFKVFQVYETIVPVLLCYDLWKDQNILYFLMFSGGIKREQMSLNLVVAMVKTVFYTKIQQKTSIESITT